MMSKFALVTTHEVVAMTEEEEQDVTADFKIQLEQMYEEETQILIQINMKRINIETQRIIIALEVTALEFRLRETC